MKNATSLFPIIYLEIGGCVLHGILATSARTASIVQSMPEIKFSIQDCFLQNFLLKIFYYFYEHSIILCAMLQKINIYSDYWSLFFNFLQRK